jgi:hypothetical protein
MADERCPRCGLAAKAHRHIYQVVTSLYAKDKIPPLLIELRCPDLDLTWADTPINR